MVVDQPPPSGMVVAEYGRPPTVPVVAVFEPERRAINQLLDRLRGPRWRALCNGEQVASLVGELDRRCIRALVWRVRDLPVLALVLLKALIVRHFSDNRGYRWPTGRGTR